MKKFGEAHPVIHIVILFVIGVLFAGVVGGILNVLGFDNNVSGSIARILIGIVFLVIHYKKFKFGHSFKGLVVMLPVLLLAIYKIPYHYISGGGTPNAVTVPILIIGLAPAIFEEILFRGILVFNLKKKLDNPIAIVFISALVFSLVHLTNIMGMDLISLLVQLIMAFVTGVVLGAVYLKTG
ncbi:MAG: CPBP family intramembrane metalloprotease, partial [Firmicutes bacterium]|nr:CPBP family intramembrane metalloprotease [Bacillota bacterium]